MLFELIKPLLLQQYKIQSKYQNVGMMCGFVAPFVKSIWVGYLQIIAEYIFTYKLLLMIININFIEDKNNIPKKVFFG